MNLVITWPKKRTLASYLVELDKARRGGQQINFRVGSRPSTDVVGQRCYIVHDGMIRGWNRILGVTWRSDGVVQDPVTGGSWPEGWYIVRDPEWHALHKPVVMRGFQGFRYVEDGMPIRVARR